MNHIEEFYDLQDNWDGYGAEKIPVVVIERTKELLLGATEQVDIFPTGRKSINIEFINRPIEIEVFEDKIICLDAEDNEYEISMELANKTLGKRIESVPEYELDGKEAVQFAVKGLEGNKIKEYLDLHKEEDSMEHSDSLILPRFSGIPEIDLKTKTFKINTNPNNIRKLKAKYNVELGELIVFVDGSVINWRFWTRKRKYNKALKKRG